jgi:hypothetical protein
LTLSFGSITATSTARQTLNSNLWFDQPEPGDPKSTDPLELFYYDTQNSTYTSDMVKDWTTFNYTYDNLVPPTQPSSGSGTVQPEMLLAVQPQPAVQSAHSVSVSHAISATHHETLKRTLNGLYGNTRKGLLSAPGIHGQKNDYIINILYDRLCWMHLCNVGCMLGASWSCRMHL